MHCAFPRVRSTQQNFALHWDPPPSPRALFKLPHLAGAAQELHSGGAGPFGWVVNLRTVAESSTARRAPLVGRLFFFLALALAGACQIGTAWAGLQLNSFNHLSTVADLEPKPPHVSFLVFWVLAGACQRNGVGGFIVKFIIIIKTAACGFVSLV